MNDKLTKSDVEKIEKEIEHRKLVVRPEAIEAVKEARSYGDLSEKYIIIFTIKANTTFLL